jgi:hypothetical protein
MKRSRNHYLSAQVLNHIFRIHLGTGIHTRWVAWVVFAHRQCGGAAIYMAGAREDTDRVLRHGAENVRCSVHIDRPSLFRAIFAFTQMGHRRKMEHLVGAVGGHRQLADHRIPNIDLSV